MAVWPFSSALAGREDRQVEEEQLEAEEEDRAAGTPLHLQFPLPWLHPSHPEGSW